MASGDVPLKRLGGGRWESRDGRFRIESESGRWVVVDGEQTDELGLPRVHGPYRSLGEARGQLEALASSEPAPSPLAERLAAVRARPAAPRARPAARGRPATGRARSRPAPGPVETWLAGIPPGDRDRALRLRDRLRALGVGNPETVVADDLTGARPAVAEALLRVRIATLVERARRGGSDRLDDAGAEALVAAILDVLDDDGAGELPGWTMLERGGRRRPVFPGSGRRGRAG